ncbi:ABC transporter ATP-binding protein [soil metagenome]
MNQPAPVSATRPWATGAASPFIRIEGVSKTFGETVAVDDVTLDIYQGELFCLLGASGCGKSTLLRMLAGFEAPSAGRIEIDGDDMAGIAPYERPTNMMFQSYALFPHMSVERNVAYGLLREGIARAEALERAHAMLRLVQLDALAARRPHQLSGGQKQRVALARALVKRPKLLLLDEPLAALDRKLREETQFELINIQETLGITFIIVTHDQEEAMTLSSRIGVMEAGRIVQVGEPPEIYEQPASRFIADFVGSVNLFEGRVAEAAPGHTRIASAAAGGSIHVGHASPAAPGQPVWYALRPEKMRLDRQRPEARNALQGIVEEVLYLGGQSIFRVRLASGMQIKAVSPNLTRPAGDAISWDEPVWVSWADTAGVVLTQ